MNTDQMETFMNRRRPVNTDGTERQLSVALGVILLAYGLLRRRVWAQFVSLLGAELILRGATGYCFIYDLLGIDTSNLRARLASLRGRGVRIEKTVTVERKPEEVYRFWRDFTNLPLFMRHLKSVKMQGSHGSHWVAEGPDGKTVEWEGEIISDIKDQAIAWHSLPGSAVHQTGSVRFEPKGSDSTRVTLLLQYATPNDHDAQSIKSLLGPNLEARLRGELRDFRTLMEQA